MRKVLIITYYWPPAGGPGVQRLLKFVKYLPDFGWQPVVLTVTRGNYPAYDESLVNEVSPQIKVVKTDNWEPDLLYKKFTGKKNDNIPVAVLAAKNQNWKTRLAHWFRLNVFVPDAKIGWLLPAVKTASRIIREENIELIYSSSPPPTTHLIAKRLKQKFKLKWIADFRDPWTKIHYYRNTQRSVLARYFDEILEKKVVHQCDAITTASRMFQDLLPIDGSKLCRTITNGYDDEVLNTPYRSKKEFVLLHAGGITANRFHVQFFCGLQKFLRNKEAAKATLLTLIGKVNPEIISRIKEYIPAENLIISGYLPHAQALACMKSAAVNLIFLEKMTDYKGHIPGKIFEYLAVQRPIIGAGDEKGDTASIIAKSGCGKVYGDDADWLKIFEQSFAGWNNNNAPAIDLQFIEQFHRRKLTEKLADLFNEII